MYELLYRLLVLRRRITCFFIDHKEQWDYSVDDTGAYCSRCDISWPMDRLTVPGTLNSFYVWLCDRRWSWFDRLDYWLGEKYLGRLPSWWEY